MEKKIAALLAALFVFACAGCAPRESEPEAEFRVVTSFYPMYIMALNLANGVAGVAVDNMAGQQAGCLHDYQMQSKDLKNVELADLFVINGADMESFMDKVTEQLPSVKMLNTGVGIELLEENGEANPHVWVSVTNCMAQVKTMMEGLAEADPPRAEAYRENGQAYLAKLADLRERMHEAVDPLPHKDIVTFHEAFPYFAQEFGLNIAAVLNREPDSAPSAKDLAATIHLVEDAGVKALFAEPQYPQSAADIVAAESGATVYFLDPATTGPNDPNAYLDAMEKNMEVLKQALK